MYGQLEATFTLNHTQLRPFVGSNVEDKIIKEGLKYKNTWTILYIENERKSSWIFWWHRADNIDNCSHDIDAFQIDIIFDIELDVFISFELLEYVCNPHMCS